MIASLHFRRPVTWLVLLMLLACSEHDDTTGPIDNGGDVSEITITNFAFSAPTLTVARGATVRWRNTTGSFHTVTPDGHQAFVERQTNTQGQVFETRFDTPGRYRYYCVPHRALGMTGEIVVN